jgi:uncharacterized protein (UPF0248 family)
MANAKIDINKALPDLNVRIWPARFTSEGSAVLNMDYEGCYLIGLSKNRDADSYKTAAEKKAGKLTLEKCLTRFLDQLHADHTYYDPSSSWIGIEVAKQNAVKELRLDSRQWGDYEADFDADSDDEDEDEVDDAAEDSEDSDTTCRPSTQPSLPLSTSKLRPSSDVLNRLRWDPNIDLHDYIIGYEDRFLGAKETSLERWKTEQTHEEFVPQHRILYFKRKSDGVVVWERRTRTDLVFRSGASAK